MVIEEANKNYLTGIATSVTTSFDMSAQYRLQRNALLQASDWTQVSDCSLTEEKKAEWQAYRQELRDITAQESWPKPIWPSAPSK
jgi:hypothetical protein